jgi:diguanylate cyclase (GGDEF)-like protein
MSLRKKALLLVVIIATVTSAAVYLVSYRIIQQKFDHLEDERVRVNLERINNAFRHEQDHLDALAANYATWDSTYRYMRTRYSAYETSELSDEIFTGYHVRLYLLIDTSGRVVLCRDYVPSRSICTSYNRLKDYVAAASRIAGPRWEISGTVISPSVERPMLLAVRPILRTDGAGPSRGVLVVGRPIDESTIQSMSRLLAFSLQAFRPDDPHIPGDAFVQGTAATGTNTEFVQIVDSNRIAGFLRLDNVDGKPGLVFRTDLTRDLHWEGAVVQRWLFAELFGVVLLMASSAFVVLQRAILKPIARLGDTVNSVTSSGDLSARAEVRGQDEFSTLARAFNAMLGELECSRRELLVVQETLEYRVQHDPLTGMLNRSAIAKELFAESARCKREGGAMAVMMVDLDHFKRINDDFGHAAGDEALRRTSELIRTSLRPYDRVGRYGGEEFLIVAPNVTKDDALRLAERLRGTISSIALTDASGCSATVSVGVTLTDGVEDWREVVCAADAALYRAKQTGRNRVEFIACDGMLQPAGCKSVFRETSIFPM